ncbi:hypothetical protein O4157_16740 [Gordonia amicalis]|uniref:hypothetical protein n=1 Tax=Gordonia amicalis TaxID=89053 RepID=UPI0022B44671|nr:hypothetical protein [Gordonia amicalis]MCZ4653061.1 hypothetical protein [Gordonia amicalis]
MALDNLMVKGAQGQLLSELSVVRTARHNDTAVVIGIYSAATVVSAIASASVMGSPGARIVLDLLLWAVWASIAYFFVAIGTRLSHNVALWGIALVATLIAAANLIIAMIGLLSINTANTLLADTGIDVPGAGVYVTLIVMSGAFGGAAVYCFVKMRNGVAILTRGTPFPTQTSTIIPQPSNPQPSWFDAGAGAKSDTNTGRSGTHSSTEFGHSSQLREGGGNAN